MSIRQSIRGFADRRFVLESCEWKLIWHMHVIPNTIRKYGYARYMQRENADFVREKPIVQMYNKNSCSFFKEQIPH